jgi:hypothetical protein
MKVRDQAEGPLGVRRGWVPGDKSVRLALEFVERDRAVGPGVGRREIRCHVRGQIVVGGTLHDHGGRLFDGLAAFEDQLRVAFGHRFLRWPELVVGFHQTFVATFADGAVACKGIGDRPTGDGEGKAGIGAQERE